MKFVYVIVAKDATGQRPAINVAAQSDEEQQRFWIEHNCLPIGNKRISDSLRAIVGNYWKRQQKIAADDPQLEPLTDQEVTALIDAYGSNVHWNRVELLG